MADFSRIEVALAQLARQLRRALWVENGLWYGAGLLAALTLALLLAEVGFTPAGVLFLLASAIGGLAVAAYLTLRATAGLRGAFALAPARLAEGLAPELGTAASAAVDLARQLERARVPFSKELAAAHIDRTARRLGELPLDERLRQGRLRPRRTALLALGAAALVASLMVILLEQGRTRLATLLLNPDAVRLSDAPLAGDIKLTYNYPAYTGLGQRVVEGGDGSISAVVGTEVTLQAIADRPTRQAWIRFSDMSGKELQEIPMLVSGGRELTAKQSILVDGRYHFVMVDEEGDRLEERQEHPVRAVLDAYPEAAMDEPTTDVELKDDQVVQIAWRAKDDFGVGEVSLVVEPEAKGPDGAPAPSQPKKIRLATPESGASESRREGRYRLTVAELGLPAGTGARFYVEVWDNDAIAGPKRSVSSMRRLSLFSARANHDKLEERQRQAEDAMVDWLAGELGAPFPTAGGAEVAKALDAQQALEERMTDLVTLFVALVSDMRKDSLTKPEITAAFDNVLEHVGRARDARRRLTDRAKEGAGAQAYAELARGQAAAVTQLEKDIIYLDDLLTLQRIDDLKSTARELLAAQRGLQEALERYKDTKDPALRAQLEQQIRDMRERMMQLMARMAQIRKELPGEYRNMEAAAMLQLDDQLDRLEKLLREGDLEKAAAELEQLANMIENMVESIDEAEEEYGGERYAEMRKKLGEFAQQFRELETQQKALAQRTEEMLKEYRKKSIERAGKSLEELVKKARERTQQAQRALDEVAAAPNAAGMEREAETARQRLLDLDALLEHRDFFEARQVAEQAEESTARMASELAARAGRQGERSGPEAAQARDGAAEAAAKSREVREMLDKLFPDPERVMTPEQMAQLRRMSQRQQELQQKAEQLGQRMDGLAQEMPLFGGEPRMSLDAAEQEMGQAAGAIGRGSLPGAAGHERRAVEQLDKLRQSLEEASKRGGGRGMPLPIGGAGSSGHGNEGGTGNRQEEVAIPQSDPNRAGPQFRKELLEAAKQKPPERYEDAVQRYYKELIR